LLSPFETRVAIVLGVIDEDKYLRINARTGWNENRSSSRNSRHRRSPIPKRKSDSHTRH